MSAYELGENYDSSNEFIQRIKYFLDFHKKNCEKNGIDFFVRIYEKEKGRDDFSGDLELGKVV